MIADAVTPAGQPDGPSDIGFAQSAAGVGTIAMHYPGPVVMGRRIAPGPGKRAAQAHGALALVKTRGSLHGAPCFRIQETFEQ